MRVLYISRMTALLNSATAAPAPRETTSSKRMQTIIALPRERSLMELKGSSCRHGGRELVSGSDEKQPAAAGAGVDAQ